MPVGCRFQSLSCGPLEASEHRRFLSSGVIAMGYVWMMSHLLPSQNNSARLYWLERA